MSTDDQDLIEELALEGPPPRRSDTLERGTIVPFAPPDHLEYTRDLTEADLEALAAPRGITPKSLVRIHYSHHTVARCIAAGMKPNQVSMVVGMTPVRISQLTRDPAFAALVRDYQMELKGELAQLAERMNNLSLDAIEVLHDRLHDNPELITTDTLLDIVKAMADRTGHGPNQEVRLKVDTDFIDRPPRETFEDWQKRRASELDTSTTVGPSPKTVN